MEIVELADVAEHIRHGEWNVGNLLSPGNQGVGYIELPTNSDAVAYLALKRARNGDLQQLTQFKRIDGKWKYWTPTSRGWDGNLNAPLVTLYEHREPGIDLPEWTRTAQPDGR